MLGWTSIPTTRSTMNASVIFGDTRFTVSSLGLPVKGQDRLLVRDDFAGVADGATPVASSPRDVGDFAAAALMAIAGHEPTSLRQAVRCAIREVGHLTDDPAATPSATLALAQARGGHLELGVLGDCLAVVALRDGATLVVPRDVRLLEIDRHKEAVIAGVLGQGLSLQVARAQIRPLHYAQRNEMNRPGGYWVFASTPEAADHLLEVSVILESVDALLLCSDGFARLCDHFAIYPDPAALLAGARSVGLPALGRLLRTIESADDPPIRAPRTSIYDDASALLFERMAGV